MANVNNALELRKKRLNIGSASSSTNSKTGNDRVSSALERRNKRMEEDKSTKINEIIRQVNNEITISNNRKSNTYGEGAYKNSVDSTRNSRVHIDKLLNEVETYRSYMGDDQANSLINTLNRLKNGYSDYMEAAKVREPFKNEEEYNTAVKEATRMSKYKGKTYGELQQELNSLRYDRRSADATKDKELSEEISWLEKYSTTDRSVVDSMTLPELEKLKVERDKISADGSKKISELEKELNEASKRGRASTGRYYNVIYANLQKAKKDYDNNRNLYYDDNGFAVTLDNLIGVRRAEGELERISSSPTAKSVYDKIIAAEEDIPILEQLNMSLRPASGTAGTRPYEETGLEALKDDPDLVSYEKTASKYGIDLNKTLDEIYYDIETAMLHNERQRDGLIERLENEGYSWDDLSYYLKYKKDRDDYAQKMKNAEYVGKTFPALSTVANIAVAPFQAVDLVKNIGEKPYGLTNIYDDDTVNSVNARTSAVAQSIQDGVPNEIAGWLLSTAYSGISSSVQSLVTTGTMTALFGPAGTSIGLGILGSQAAASSFNQAIKNGSTNGEALATGIVAGVAEALFERMPLDNLMNMAKGLDTSSVAKLIRSGLVQVGKQGIIEGLEEAGTNITNTIADHIINGDHSSYDVTVDQLVRAGMPLEEAQKEASKQWLMEFAGDFLGGFFGGMASGGGTSAVNVISNVSEAQANNRYTKAIGAAIIADPVELGALSEVADNIVKYNSRDIGKQAADVNNAVKNANVTQHGTDGVVTDIEDLRSLERNTARLENGNTARVMAAREVASAFKKMQRKGSDVNVGNLFAAVEESLYNTFMSARNVEELNYLRDSLGASNMYVAEAYARSYEAVTGEAYTRAVEAGLGRTAGMPEAMAESSADESLHPAGPPPFDKGGSAVLQSNAPRGEFVGANSNVIARAVDSNGREVGVVGMDSDGKVITTEGKVASESLSFTDPQFDTVVEDAKAYKGAEDVYLQTFAYMPKQMDAATYDRVFNNFYTAGSLLNMGINFEDTWAKSNVYSNVINKEYAEAIFNEARKIATAERNRRSARNDAQAKRVQLAEAKKKAATPKGITGKVSGSAVQELSQRERAIFETIAREYKLEVDAVGVSGDGAKGYANAVTRRIAVSLASGNKVSTLLHECGHIMKAWAPDTYKLIQNAVVDWYLKLDGGDTLGNRIEQRRKLYAEKGEILDTEEVLDEITNNALEAAQRAKDFDKTFVKSLAEDGYTKTETRGILAKLKAFFEKLRSVLKKATATVTKTDTGSADMITAEGMNIAEDMEMVENMLEMLERGMTEVRDNYAAYIRGENEGIVDGQLKMSAPVEETADLIALHNITESQLDAVIKEGSIAGPSIAISKNGITKFGELSFIFPKSSIDPNTNRDNKLYGSDAWTPGQTTLKKNAVFDTKKTEAAINEVRGIIGNEHSAELFDMTVQDIQDTVIKAKGDIHRAFDNNIGLQTAYALKEGIIESIPENNDGSVNISRLTEMLKALSSGDGVTWGEYRRQFVEPLIDSAITRYDAATVEETVEVMREKPDSAKTFKLTADGTLTVPAARYKSIDALKANKHKLSADADTATAEVGMKFVQYAGEIAEKTKNTTDAVVTAINSAFEFRYSAESIVTSFKEDGITINKNEAEALRSLYKKAVDLPSEYFEAKAMRAVPINEAVAVAVPQSFADERSDVMKYLKDMNIKVVTYETGNDASRIQAINSVEGVRFQRLGNAEEEASIKNQLVNHIEEINRLDPVAEVEYTPMSKLQVAQKASEEFKKFGYTVDRQNFGKIEIDTDRISEGIKYTHNEAEKAAIFAVPKILKRGINISGHDNHKGRNFTTFTFAAPIKINGVLCNVAVVVRKTKNFRYHAHRVLLPDGSKVDLFNEKDTEPTFAGVKGKNRQGPAIGSVSTNRITQPNKKVKKNSSTYSQHTLTEEQEKKLAHEVKALKEENEALKKLDERRWNMIDYLQRQLDQWKRGGKKLDYTAIDKLAGKLISENSSKLDRKELAKELTSLFNYMADSKNPSVDVLKNRITDIASRIVNSASAVNHDVVEQQRFIKDRLSRGVRFNDNQKGDAIHRFGSMAEYKAIVGSSVRVTDKGVPLDDVWGELSAKYPHLFPEDTVDADQPILIADVLEALGRNRTYNPFAEIYAGDLNLAIGDISAKIIDGYYGIPGLVDAKSAYKTAYAEARDYYNLERDRLVERLKESRAWYKNYYKTWYQGRANALAYENAQKFKEYRDSRALTDEKNRVKKIMKTLYTTLAESTKTRYAPVEVFKAVVDVCEAIDLEHNLDTKLGQRMAHLQRKYLEMLDNDEILADYKSEFSERIYKNLNAITDNLGDRSISELSYKEMYQLRTALEDVTHTLVDARRQIGTEEFVENYGLAMQMIKEIDEAPRPSGLSKLIAGSALNPMNAAEMMSGYNPDSVIMKLFNRLRKGERERKQYYMDAHKAFDKLMSQKEYKDFITKEYDVGLYDAKGHRVMLTQAEMAQIIMSWEREQTSIHLNHLNEGGIKIPDLKLLKKGKLTEALNNSKYVRNITVSDISRMRDKMDDYSKSWMSVSREYFNGLSRKAVNDVSMKLLHRITATAGDYIPFEVDDNFRVTEIKALQYNKLLENAGILKSITPGARQPLVIMGLNICVDRNIDTMAKLKGLAIPLRDVQKVYNTIGMKEDDGVSVKKAIEENGWNGFGTPDKKGNLFEQVLTEMQAGRTPTEHSDWYNEIRRNQIHAILSYKISAALKNTTAYTIAGQKLSAKSLAAGITKTPLRYGNMQGLFDEIDRYTPLHYMRRVGLSTPELAEMANVRKTKGTYFRGENWIKGMDVLVTASLWEACKSEIDTKIKKGEIKNCTKGSDAYFSRVAKLYNEVLEETQQNNDILFKSEMQRSKNFVLQQATLFKTDMFVNYNILHSSTARLNATSRMVKNAKTDAEKAKAKILNKQAKTTFGKAVASQLIGNAVLTLMTLIGNGLFRHKLDKYRDEEGDLGIEGVAEELMQIYIGTALETVSAPVSAFFDWAGYAESLITGDKFYENEELVSGMVSDLTNGTGKLVDAVVEMWNEEKTSAEKAKELIDAFKNTAITVLEATKGIPAGNIEDIVNATFLYGQDLFTEKALFDSGYERTTKEKTAKVIELVESEKFKEATSFVSDWTYEKALELAEKDGLTEKDLKDKYYNNLYTDKAKSALKTLFKERYKEDYLEALEKKDQKTVKEIRVVLYNTGLYTVNGVTDIDAVFTEWRKEAFKKKYEQKYKAAVGTGDTKTMAEIEALVRSSGYYKDPSKTLKSWRKSAEEIRDKQ